MSVKVNVLHQT